jgi:hypothetical protein
MGKKLDWEAVAIEELSTVEVDDIRKSFRGKPRETNSASGILRRALEPCKKGQGRRIGPLDADQVKSARTVLPAVAQQLGWHNRLRARSRAYKTKLMVDKYGKSYLSIVRL